jgi:hypothetical protein
MFVLILAMPINWLIEALKWHRLIRRNESFKISLREVLIGASWALITPNRSGDVVARVALLPSERRAQGTRAFMTGAFAQMWITGFAGTCAWWILCTQAPQHLFLFSEWKNSIGFALLFFTLSSLCVYLLWRWPLAWDRFHIAASEIKSKPLPLRVRLETLLLSLIRYLVFTGQFFAALTAWEISVASMKGWYIPLIYLGNMIIPSAALSDMGTREALTLALFQPNTSQLWAIVVAVFSIWVINLAIPALAGSILSFRPNLVRNWFGS